MQWPLDARPRSRQHHRMELPLAGVRVIDLTVYQHGPYASTILANLGADVIKVEEVHSGDPGRYAWYSRATGLSSFFQAHNHGKRSIALNLKDERGREIMMRLVGASDVLLHNFRIAAIERLGLGYDAVSAANPRIVYVQASAYGPAGDERDAGAFDYVAQARSGFASTNGEPDDPPLPSVVAIGDQSGALHACIAVLAGLAGRAATGHGAKYDTSLLGSMLAMQSFDIDNYLFTGELRERFYHGGTRPFWRVYRGGDGKWFVIGMLLDRAWPEVCDVIGRPELVRDGRFASYRSRMFDHAPELMAILEEAFAGADARVWVERLNAIGMLAAPVQDHAEVAVDPQVAANAYIQDVARAGGEPVRMVNIGVTINDEPVRVPGLAPELGEHTEAVLRELGFEWPEIEQLRAAGVIGPASGQQTNGDI
jgi:crotonobetainyl-CoA:carnitine CoA-transferase CaiB-like acyl-CoA transferase